MRAIGRHLQDHPAGADEQLRGLLRQRLCLEAMYVFAPLFMSPLLFERKRANEGDVESKECVLVDCRFSQK